MKKNLLIFLLLAFDSTMVGCSAAAKTSERKSAYLIFARTQCSFKNDATKSKSASFAYT